MGERRIAVFFYGSYINRDVLAEVDIRPECVEVAELGGFDIIIRPLANLVPDRGKSVCGILTDATHPELERLYTHAREILGATYLPEAVLVRARGGFERPALCYVAPAMEPRPPTDAYLDRILGPARAYGFPADYVAHLESFRR